MQGQGGCTKSRNGTGGAPRVKIVFKSVTVKSDTESIKSNFLRGARPDWFRSIPFRPGYREAQEAIQSHCRINVLKPIVKKW